MKKLLTAILMGGTMMATTAEAKTLVTYFTLTGNTEKAAKIIAEETGADLYKIELVTPYPAEKKNWLTAPCPRLSLGRKTSANMTSYLWALLCGGEQCQHRCAHS